VSEQRDSPASIKQVNWQLVLGEGFISLLFSLALAIAVSIVAYSMFASLAERKQGDLLNMSYLDAAPRVAALAYGAFFMLALLAMTRLRIYSRGADHRKFNWLLAYAIFGVIGLVPGVVFWLMLYAADRPGI
jgi:ATP/ADP translocase